MGWVLEAEVEFYQKYRKLVLKKWRDFIVFSIVTLLKRLYLLLLLLLLYCDLRWSYHKQITSLYTDASPRLRRRRPLPLAGPTKIVMRKIPTESVSDRKFALLIHSRTNPWKFRSVSMYYIFKVFKDLQLLFKKNSYMLYVKDLIFNCGPYVLKCLLHE